MQSNAELIRAVIFRNDHDAFANLVERYERLVWTVVWRILRDYHATQDVTQETFLIAHRSLQHLRDPDSIGSWLSQIAAREAQRAQKRSVQIRVFDEIDPAMPDAGKQMEQDRQSLLSAVADLPEHERVVTALRYLNGHSVAEVALLTGRSVGTVTKQLSRAKERLKCMFRVEQSDATTSNPAR